MTTNKSSGLNVLNEGKTETLEKVTDNYKPGKTEVREKVINDYEKRGKTETPEREK